ncbi:hypothetical protein BDN72DRAFT_858083 [Pluteus cervinus]|uniref:Uncharacterized protein n=1 Tax=Pluteus cervinus TaxID=181527 RepID=A0ACD3AV72_9AGAR|nr:hypothetical protein BDN72DRAFT_858083 [Pluteus cervinus]
MSTAREKGGTKELAKGTVPINQVSISFRVRSGLLGLLSSSNRNPQVGRLRKYKLRVERLLGVPPGRMQRDFDLEGRISDFRMFIPHTLYVSVRLPHQENAHNVGSASPSTSTVGALIVVVSRYWQSVRPLKIPSFVYQRLFRRPTVRVTTHLVGSFPVKLKS